MRSAALPFLLFAFPVLAQVEPRASASDPKFLELNYSDIEPMRLTVARGGDLTVTLSREEHIQSVSTAEPSQFQITTGQSANELTIHAQAGATSSTLSVLTEARVYNFVLTPVPVTRAPYGISLTYLATTSAAEVAPPERARRGEYRLTGNRELRPVGITDDGQKTYIEWGHDQPLPAVFAIDRLGREEMVNGYMRDDLFTLDRVYSRLVFRIDRIEAHAIRIEKRQRK